MYQLFARTCSLPQAINRQQFRPEYVFVDSTVHDVMSQISVALQKISGPTVQVTGMCGL